MSTNNEKPPLTDFGYQQVALADKTRKVRDVFTSVADKYDIMNDLMSFGVHRLWKRFTINASHIKSGDYVLDIAGGTGDLAKAWSKRVGNNGQVILSDINAEMLYVGRDRLIDEGILHTIQYVQANAECLPFADNSFNAISIAFGLRNVTDKQKALQSMYKALKPGGQVLILEFSKPILPLLEKIYDQYSFNVIPWLGKLVTGDEQSYRYLVESIRMHPDQDKLKNMMQQAGFEDCSYHNLSGGIVALHKGYKY